MAITTPESLLALVEKSGLLDAEQLARAAEAAGEADDARSLAKLLARQGLLTLWQAGQLLAGRSAFLLGKYKLIDLLGSGGMGRVFLAEHTTMSRPVALKIISKRLGRDPASLKQFLTEARAIAALDHPNIVHAYNVDNEGDRYYIVMEFVEGKDLQRMVEAKGPLDCERAAGYVRQAAEGLAHAHRRNMIHCDVKPANLLVSEQDVVKILDMGMARLIGRGADSGSEKDDRLLGTVDYLAPEQAMESPDLDHRVDVYSLGCTFYFLLTGRPPFPEGTLHERILKHQTQEPKKIAELRADAPEDVVEVCEKMMAKDPGDRFQSAEEVGQALAECHVAEVILEPDEPADESASPAGAVGVQAATAAASSAAGMAGATSGVWARVQEEYGKRPRTFLFGGIGGAVAVGLLATMFLLMGGSGQEADSEVAQGSAQAEEQNSTDADASATGPSEPNQREAKDKDEWPDFPETGNLTDFDPEEIAAEIAAEIGSSPANSGKAKEPDKPAPKKPEKEEPKAQAEPKPAAAEAMSEPEKPKPDEKKPDKEKPAEKKEADAKKPDAETPKKEEPKKPEPPKPLSKLAEVVDIPELATGTGAEPPGVFTIGTIQTGPDVEWQLYLLGGKTAAKKNREFVLQQEDASAAKASWMVRFDTGSTSDDATLEDVAKIWREGKALRFQWAKEPSSSANYLRNCILQVRVEGESKYVTLTHPKPAEPILIDLGRTVANASVPVKWLPGGGSLRFEITKVEGRKGHALDPAEPPEPKAPLVLAFPRTDMNGNTTDRVAFRLNFSLKPAAMLIKLQLLEPPSTFFRNIEGNTVILRNRNEVARDQVRAKLNPKDKDKAPRGTERSNLLKQLGQIEYAMWYISFYDEVQAKAKIHFRLYNDVDGRKVVLAST
ncbi:MAG: serine/threonine protein kinase [Planctomycetes bacterium]|nr:serine/threonine protein kinase [Planctomycetota bacterium]